MNGERIMDALILSAKFAVLTLFLVHIWRCVYVEDYLFLMLGLIVPTLAPIHGAGVLLGYW